MSQSGSPKETLQEYGRGIIGGLIFSLPLLYTMEVWWRGFTAPASYLLIFVVVTFLLLLGYNTYAGMRKDASFWDICWDSVEELGLALVVSFLFLFLIGKINFNMPVFEIAGKIIVESMIVAIGISVGTAQLGQKKKQGSGGSSQEKSKKDSLFQVFVLSVCGAVFMASSVAPTAEILRIGIESGTINIIIMVIISLLLSGIILFFTDFVGATNSRNDVKRVALEIIISYSSALLVSFFLLWFFGRVVGYSISIIVAEIVVLAVPGSLGASAGRLLIGNK